MKHERLEIEETNTSLQQKLSEQSVFLDELAKQKEELKLQSFVSDEGN